MLRGVSASGTTPDSFAGGEDRRQRYSAVLGRRGMARRLVPARLVIGALLTALLATVVSRPVPMATAGEACPEPNDMSQTACYLASGSAALGVIACPDDVDGYRIETRDFGVRVNLELLDRPFPYRLSLVNFDGTLLSISDDARINATLDLPGSYYAFVESVTGDVDPERPY